MAGDSSVEVPESKGKTEIHLRGPKVYGVLSQLSGRALARAALGREFPISALSIAERVPSPTIAHVSSRPP